MSTLASDTIAAVDLAIDMVRRPCRPGRRCLFDHVDPLFFSLSALHGGYVSMFDRAIRHMDDAERSPEAAFDALQRMISDYLPARRKINLLTRELKLAADNGRAGAKDPLRDWIRKINWYFHMGFGGITRSRLMMVDPTSLYDILQDWRGDFIDPALLLQAKRLRQQLVIHWAALCTAYTRVKLAYLEIREPVPAVPEKPDGPPKSE